MNEDMRMCEMDAGVRGVRAGTVEREGAGVRTGAGEREDATGGRVNVNETGSYGRV